MSRYVFGRWGRDLDHVEFARALAALGVLIRAKDIGLKGSALRSPDRYAELLAEATQRDGTLMWGLSPLDAVPRDRWREALARVDALGLARAWSSSISERPETILLIGRARSLDPAWLFKTLTPESLGLADVHGELRTRPGRVRWGWPLRVGFLAEPASLELRASLYEGLAAYLAALTDPETGPVRCDLLLMPYGPTRALRVLEHAMPAPEATCVVLVGEEATLQHGVDRVPRIASRVSGRSLALAPVPGDAHRVWFEVLLTELSHDVPLNLALRAAGRAGSAGPTLLFAARNVFQQATLSNAVGALTERILATADGGTVDLPSETAVAMGLPETVEVAEAARRARDTGLPFDHEREGATHTAHLARAARPIVHEAERRQSSARFIRARVRDRHGGKESRLEWGFRAGESHEILVSIGPKEGDWLAAELPFREDLLPPDPNGHRLTVVLTEPELLEQPLTATIELPQTGASGNARFRLDVPEEAERVEARISILHRGRILQTALLRGPVLPDPDVERGPGEERIQVLIEAVLRPGMAGLDERQRFDAAVVLNQDAAGHPSGTLLSGRSAASLQLDWAKEAIQSIEAVFYEAEKDDAFDRELGSESSLRYLRRLARQGRLLYERVGTAIERVHRRNVSYIQILSANPNTFLPVELIYDLATPSHEATLCPNAMRALESGRCDPGKFHSEDQEGHLEVVCPSGFWGVTKVIERHAVDPNRLTEDPDTRGVDFLALSDPIGDRNTLGTIAPVLFAASDHVNDVEKKELDRVTASLRKLMDGAVEEADTWVAWVRTVEAKEPALLLLLPHTALDDLDGAALEISKESAQQRRYVADINEHYVNLNTERVGPIVLLLGCDTATPHTDFQSFVVQFKEKGSSVVVGTIAPILGRHASRTAEALVEQLGSIDPGAGGADRGVPFGELMRRIRRNLLAKGVLISLCLTSYGDADWRFAPGH